MDTSGKKTGKYYAVIFSSVRNEADDEYDITSDRMKELASGQPGYIGIESARNPDGSGITVSYWESLEAIRDWKRNSEHIIAQQKGKKDWYSTYHVRICELVHEY